MIERVEGKREGGRKVKGKREGEYMTRMEQEIEEGRGEKEKIEMKWDG